MINCDCPRCASRNTKAFSVLHRDGVKDSLFRRAGWSYFFHTFGIYGSTTRGRSQTLTSQLAAPPVPSATRFLRGGGVLVVLLLGAALAGATGVGLALAALIWFAVTSGRNNDRLHGQRLQQWGSTFRCGRCGTVFAIVEPEGAAQA